MPSLTLKELHLHRSDDYAVFITFDGGTEAVQRTKPGENRVMASGRVRSVTQPGSTLTLEVTCPFIDPATYDTLDAWIAEGAELMLRDAKRRVVWGHAYGLSGPVSQATEETVSFTFQTITFDEEI